MGTYFINALISYYQIWNGKCDPLYFALIDPYHDEEKDLGSNEICDCKKMYTSVPVFMEVIYT